MAPRVGSTRPLAPPEYALLALYHHPDWSLVEQLAGMEEEEQKVQDIVHRFVAYHADVRPSSGPRAA